MNINCETIIQTRLIDPKTRKVLKESAPMKNLVLDNGLNALARSTNATVPASFATGVRVGSGSTANSFASGAITFTQSGATVTASAGFFNAGMVGMLFKWGTGSGGNERYILTYISATQVTVDTSETVAAPDVATVWNVARSTLETLLYSSATHETTTGACETTFSGGQITHKRTINFPQQAASYNVNEIGYFSSTAGTTVFGRIVLPATEVVPPTSFLQVVISFSVNYSPAAPTAVTNVGTNIDTAGNAMIETVSNSNAFKQVTSTGGVSAVSPRLDGVGTAPNLQLCISNYTQNATPGAALTPTIIIGPSATWVYNSVRGQMSAYFNAPVSTSGQTLYGFGLGATTNIYADIKLTTPYVLPVGSFLPQTRFYMTYNRTLTN